MSLSNGTRSILVVIATVTIMAPIVTRQELPGARAAVSGHHWELGPDELQEPFQCFTDGAFSVVNIGGTVSSTPPVNQRACEHWIWSGDTVDTMWPSTQMTGITYDTHTDPDRGDRVFDTAGWWPMGLWVDSSTGTWYSFMHTEDHEACDQDVPTGPSKDLRTVGVWSSTDDGASWTYGGIVLSLDFDYAFDESGDNDCYTQTGWPKVGGPGDFKLIVGQDDYLYLAYRQNTYNKPVDNNNDGAWDYDYTRENFGIARALKTSNGTAGNWYKYYNGSWGEPGVGGHETYVMTPFDQSLGTAIVNHGDRALTQPGMRAIIWSTYLNEYVMVFSRRSNDLWLSFSSDLINWSTPEFLYKVTPKSQDNDETSSIKYVNLVSIDDGGTDRSTGRSVWMYYVIKDFEVHRRLLSFDDQTNLALDQPVVTDDNHGHGFGNVENLVDGDLSTPWVPEPRDETHVNDGWVYVDLGATTTFNQIKLFPWTRWGFGFPADFEIEGASDPQGTWTSIASYSDYPHPRFGETQVLAFSSQSYRYVRLSWDKVIGSAEDDIPFGFRLMEMQVFNNAQGAPPTPTEPTGTATTYTASTDFSSTHGTNQWSYMYKAPLDIGGGTSFFWSPMTYNTTNSWWEKAGTVSRIEPGTQNPAIGLDSGRVWRAPADGVVHITGNVAKSNTGGGDGVNVRVLRNRTKIWPADDEWQFIDFDDAVGYSIDQYEAVRAGDRIIFVVNAIDNGNSDKTAWDPTIDFEPIATTYDAVDDFGSTQGANGWTYQYYDGSSFTNLTWHSSTSTWRRSGSTPILGPNQHHPDGTYDSALTWTAPSAGYIGVEGFIRKANTTDGDGVRAKVLLNSTQVWPSSGWHSISADDAYGSPTDFALEVASGDKVHFIVNENTTLSYDNSVWDIKISGT